LVTSNTDNILYSLHFFFEAYEYIVLLAEYKLFGYTFSDFVQKAHQKLILYFITALYMPEIISLSVVEIVASMCYCIQCSLHYY